MYMDTYVIENYGYMNDYLEERFFSGASIGKRFLKISLSSVLTVSVTQNVIFFQRTVRSE